MKIDKSDNCKTKFSAIKAVPMKLENYYKKQPILILRHIIFDFS